MAYYFRGDPLQAEVYCHVQKLELIVPHSLRSDSALFGISDVIDLMVEKAVSQRQNSNILGMHCRDRSGRLHCLVIMVYWSEFEVGQDDRPCRNQAGFKYYHVEVSLAPLHPNETVTMLDDMLVTPLIQSNHEALGFDHYNN